MLCMYVCINVMLCYVMYVLMLCYVILCMYVWMDGRTDGGMDGWMDGWMSVCACLRMYNTYYIQYMYIILKS